jgi:mono/diheme cytochrome c family protein
MKVRDAGIVVLGVLLSVRAVIAWSGTPQGNALQGEKLFMREGCYTCHGTTAVGSIISGPQLAPEVVPWAAFIRQLRTPYNSWRYGNVGMPRFGKGVLTTAQAADLYAYLLSIKPGPTAAQVPLLRK